MIIINNIVNNTYTNIEGYKLFVALNNYFKTDTKVEVSFRSLSTMSSSFLNSSIGALIEQYGKSNFRKMFHPVEITKIQANALLKYIESCENHCL